jgi:hypothetical protein
MRLPSGERAVLDIAKLRDYCLSPDHARGKHKARVFRAALGIGPDAAGALRSGLLEAARVGEARLGESDDFGQRYFVDRAFAWGGREVLIRSTWIVRTGEDFPRFTTCFIL